MKIRMILGDGIFVSFILLVACPFHIFHGTKVCVKEFVNLFRLGRSIIGSKNILFQIDK